MRGLSSGYRTEPVDEYVIGAPTGGIGYTLRRRGVSTFVRPGRLVVLDPEHAHGGSPTKRGPWAARLVVLPAAMLWATGDELPALLRSTVADPVIDALALQRRFVALHEASEAGAPRLERECALLGLLEELAPVANSSRRPDGDPTVARAVEYLRDSYLQSIDLGTLADAAETTRFRLLRRFRAELGITPQQFLTSVRVSHARRLLASGISASTAAAESGFADQSHLIRQFRGRLGLTPGHYQRATR